MKRAYLISALFASAARTIHGRIFISEVNPSGCLASYVAGRLELMNTGGIVLRRRHLLP